MSSQGKAPQSAGPPHEEERPDVMPTLDRMIVFLYAPEETRHDDTPRVGDVIDVRLSVDRGSGLIVWDERCEVDRLEEEAVSDGGATEIKLELERIEEP